MGKHPVYVLITGDIDPTPEATLEEKRKALVRTQAMLDDLGVPTTFFLVGNLSEDYAQEAPALAAAGHEIGCHGLTHDIDDEYGILPEAEQRERLTEAFRRIQAVSGTPVRSFRGPRVKTSAATQRVLLELGAIADSSVCPQRLDFVSSNLINWRWLVAPRKAYRPHAKSAFRRGRLPLVVVPVSAMGLPFLSGLLYGFGLGLMKGFFRILYAEARLTGKPIVYLYHPAEFAKQEIAVRHETNLKAIKARGFYFRRRLKLRGHVDERLRLMAELIRFMAGHRHVRFVTVSQFAETILHDR